MRRASTFRNMVQLDSAWLRLTLLNSAWLILTQIDLIELLYFWIESVASVRQIIVQILLKFLPKFRNSMLKIIKYSFLIIRYSKNLAKKLRRNALSNLPFMPFVLNIKQYTEFRAPIPPLNAMYEVVFKNALGFPLPLG